MWPGFLAWWRGSAFARWAALALGAALLAWRAIAAIRRSERDRVENAGLKEIGRKIDVAHEVEMDVARDPDPAGRLRERWSRD